VSRIKRKETINNSLPVVGKIKIGDKKKSQSGKEYPVSLDYFRPTGKYAKVFEKQYPGKPNNITIIFIDDNPDYSCNERYEGRDDKGKLAGKGDGENWELYNETTDSYESVDKEILTNITKQRKLIWSEILTLRFIIPKLSGLMGVWEFTTKGKKSSLGYIRDTYDMITKQAGTVVNLPFDLCVEKVKSQKPGSTRVFPVVTLVPHISHENISKVKQFVGLNSEKLLSIGMLTDEKIKKLEYDT
jgi:hypothetical protein